MNKGVLFSMNTAESIQSLIDLFKQDPALSSSDLRHAIDELSKAEAALARNEK